MTSVLLGIALALVVYVVLYLIDRGRRPRAGIEERCARCAMENPLTGGPALQGKAIHEVIRVPHDDLEAELRQGGGGTYTAVCYCARHCPGGCQNPRCRRMVA